MKPSHTVITRRHGEGTPCDVQRFTGRQGKRNAHAYAAHMMDTIDELESIAIVHNQARSDRPATITMLRPMAD